MVAAIACIQHQCYIKYSKTITTLQKLILFFSIVFFVAYNYTICINYIFKNLFVRKSLIHKVWPFLFAKLFPYNNKCILLKALTIHRAFKRSIEYSHSHVLRHRHSLRHFLYSSSISSSCFLFLCVCVEGKFVWKFRLLFT